MFASPDLHQLIHSLSQSERRLFKLRANQTGKRAANYLRLFEVIDSQQVYDEEMVKASFVGEKILNNFSVAKAYLYQNILDSIRQGYARKSPEMEVREFLDQIELLFHRGLSDQARKIVVRAIKKAEKFDLEIYLAELYRWQRQLTNLRTTSHRIEALTLLEKAEFQSLQLARKETTLHSLRARLQSIYINHIDLRDREAAELVAELMAHNLLSEPPHDLSFLSQLHFYEIYAVYYRMAGHSDKSLASYREAVHLWQANPSNSKAYPARYLQSLTFFLDTCLREAEYTDFLDQVKKIHAMDPVEPRLKARAFYLGNHLELRYAITTYQFDIGIRRVKHIENGLKKHGLHLSPSIELTFLYNLAILYFLAQEYTHAIRFVNLVRNQSKSPVRQDIVDAARLIELVCHYELYNFDLLESRIRSINRFLKSHPRQHPYENLLLKGIRKLIDLPPSEEQTTFEDLKTAFEDMEGASYLIGREELMLWIRSHLEGIPPSEMDPPAK